MNSLKKLCLWLLDQYRIPVDAHIDFMWVDEFDTLIIEWTVVSDFVTGIKVGGGHVPSE